MDYLDLIVDGAPGLQVPIKLTSMNFEALMVRQPMGGPAARLPPPILAHSRATEGLYYCSRNLLQDGPPLETPNPKP